jgi:hypothetical protein
MSEPQQPNQPQQPQSMGSPPPNSAPQQPPPTQVVQPATQKRFRLALFLPAVLAAVVALLVGIGIGAWGGGGWGGSGGIGRTTAAPAPAVTVTKTVGASGESGGAPTEEPTQQEPEPTEATYNPKPTDFKIAIKVLEKTCYGDLGCDVTFRIVPAYVGSQSFPAKGKTEVTYEVTGGTDPITNTFEIDGEGTVTFDEEESAEIASPSTTLVATVTSVTYNEFG